MDQAAAKLACLHFNIEVYRDPRVLDYAETAGVSLRPLGLLAN